MELPLFVLLPVMVIMFSAMRLLEARNLLDRLVSFIAPAMKPFGAPALGVFALIQVLFVSFAAPMAALAIIDKSGASRRHIAATLAMVLPIVTKLIAGGTAMMGVTVDFIDRDLATIMNFNRLAGFLINPLDIAGVAIIISAGPRVAAVLRPALFGVICAVGMRRVAHLLIL